MFTKQKGALRSKAVWGAIMTLASAFGVLPWGFSFDVETGQACINVYALGASLAGIGLGSAASIFGRLSARTILTGWL